jgi:predicted N-acetyltransferase YhbS
MYTRLGEERLKSGEIAEIGVVKTPDAEFGDRIGHLLAHKGGEWQVHMDAALAGETDLLETRYYLALLDGVPIGNVMTVEYRGAGILGHVFTVPQHRRKGVCQAIMQRQMEDFRERKGGVLLLGTGFESPAYWIYHSFGFRSLKGGFMRYDALPPGEFERGWFSPGPAEIGPMEWRHWPLIALLGAQPTDDRLRSAAWRCFGIASLEGPVARTIIAMAKGTATSAVVAETEGGAVVGCATLHPTGTGTNGWPEVWLLDHFTHPAFANTALELFHNMSWPVGKVIGYVEVGATEKAEALESIGFEREGRLRGLLRTEPEPCDVWVYGKIVD